jgi:hypothetical protein
MILPPLVAGVCTICACTEIFGTLFIIAILLFPMDSIEDGTNDRKTDKLE